MLQIALMFVITNIGWLLFRETDFHALLADLSTSPWAASAEDWQAAAYFACLVCLYSIPLILHYFVDSESGFARPRDFVSTRSLALRTGSALAMFCTILVLRTANSGDFIYFKF